MLLQTEYNEVVALQQGEDSSVHNSRWLMGRVTGTRKFGGGGGKHTQSEMQRDVMENEETEKENGSEGAVQRTFNYFAEPQPEILKLFFSAVKRFIAINQ